ncbi:hypothetical protein EYC84_011762 [Monilinia fructicola]|uniref:Malic enzyme n=1 Tax=Monilinia fructicola TaxID=38448 RepID=A0A5M9J3S4_MONFR|nr:hypothetical protein EYC84_011762 [Monilinia fructicola]
MARSGQSTQPDTSHSIESYALQAQRCLKQLEAKKSPIEKYMYLSNLRNNNVHLFYRLVKENLTDITPLIYTPTVGEACLRWSEIYQQPEGLYLSYHDRGNLEAVLGNWRQPDVEMTVVTDGSRILGLGDLGVNGMGIPVGKLALYTGCAGIHPAKTLPITLDLGTNNETFLNDPLYMGNQLMVALNKTWPGIIVQYEDFKNPFPSLAKYQNKYPCFNDDIQGTGAVILAGIINALRRTGVPIKDQRAVFMGAGSAGVGVAQQIVQFFQKEGLTEDEARRCFWFVDTKWKSIPDYVQDGKTYSAGQGNNMYVFPGIGLGSILCKTSCINQEMIYASAEALSTSLTPSEISSGRLYPELNRIREVSVIVARQVIRAAQKFNFDREPSIRNLNDEQLDEWIRGRMKC